MYYTFENGIKILVIISLKDKYLGLTEDVQTATLKASNI